jgi:hypothetical protein
MVAFPVSKSRISWHAWHGHFTLNGLLEYYGILRQISYLIDATSASGWRYKSVMILYLLTSFGCETGLMWQPTVKRYE